MPQKEGPQRPDTLNRLQDYLLHRVDSIASDVAEVRVEVAKIQGGSRTWPIALAVVISLVALLLGIK